MKVSKCPHCNEVITLNAWGIPKKNRLDADWDALERARKKLGKEIGFGIKPEK